jgi:hypothetical protein
MRDLGIFVALTAACVLAAMGTRPMTAAPCPLPLPQETMNFTVQGKITQHTGQKLTLNTEGNMIFRVVYSEKTSITRQDGNAGTSKDLTVGIRIHVDGDLTESGEIIAQKIVIQPEEKKQHSTF